MKHSLLTATVILLAACVAVIAKDPVNPISTGSTLNKQLLDFVAKNAGKKLSGPMGGSGPVFHGFTKVGESWDACEKSNTVTLSGSVDGQGTPTMVSVNSGESKLIKLAYPTTNINWYCDGDPNDILQSDVQSEYDWLQLERSSDSGALHWVFLKEH